VKTVERWHDVYSGYVKDRDRLYLERIMKDGILLGCHEESFNLLSCKTKS
jgi:hypothetical protein